MNMKKYAKLIKYLKNFDRVAIAFSGGVDSTFLLKTVHTIFGKDALAITVKTPYIPDWEVEEAKNIAEEIGVLHEVLFLDIDSSISDNPDDRCYLCKRILFEKMIAFAEKLGYDTVMDGSNADDTSDYRPGMRALKELRVISPLLEAGLEKSDIRKLSKDLGLVTHDKPAYACLLTRIPHNTVIEEDVLKRVELAEVYLHSLDIRDVRVRSHGDIARIELKDRSLLYNDSLMDDISEKLKSIGYRFVTMDMSGYKMGSLNEVKEDDAKRDR